MGLFDWFQSNISKQTPRYVHGPIPSERTHGQGTPGEGPLTPGKHYFRLWLSEMYLAKSRQWFQTFYPVAHSLVRLTFGSEPVEIAHLAGPSKLQELDPDHLDRVVHLNYALTPLLPFSGGVVEILAGLFALKAENTLKTFLDVVEKFSGILQVAQLSRVIAVAGPVAEGVQSLLVQGHDGLEIGIHQGFAAPGASAPVMHPGFLAVLATDKVKLSELWVRDGRLLRGSTLESAKPLSGTSYMLFRVEARAEHDNWEALTDIAEPRSRALDALATSELQHADTHLRAAIAAAQRSKDLTRQDRARVIKALKDEFDETKRSMGLGAVPQGRPTLGELVSGVPAPVLDMSQDPELDIDLEELFAPRPA